MWAVIKSSPRPSPREDCMQPMFRATNACDGPDARLARIELIDSTHNVP